MYLVVNHTKPDAFHVKKEHTISISGMHVHLTYILDVFC